MLFRTCLSIIAVMALAPICLPAQQHDPMGSQSPVRISSGIQAQTTFYSVRDIPYRMQPFNWSLSGTPMIELYGMSLPFSFYVSNQQLGFQQPFNQLGLTPTYKWAKAHLGYSSVQFSDYTLAGRRFLGAGVELNPGKWRFGAVYGRFQKAVERDSIVQATPESYLSGVPQSSFARNGYAIKLGFGTDNNYIDLICLRAGDEAHSIQSGEGLEALRPERNTAVGLKHRLGAKAGFFWESDIAMSFYTRDDRAEPVDTGNVPAFLYRWLDPRLTSQLTYAGNMQVGYRTRAVRASLRYRRISRDFKTMGAYYFQTDIEEIASQLGLHLFKRKVHLRSNLGVQRNNLGADRLHTTQRMIISVYAGAQITKRLRTDIHYSNFGVIQRPQQPGLVDSIRIDQVLSSWQATTAYNLPSDRPQHISLQFTSQSLAPRELGFTQVGEMQSIQCTGLYSMTLLTAGLTLTVNGQWLRNNQPAGTLKSTGGGLSVSKAFGGGALQTRAGLRIHDTRFEEMQGGVTYLVDASISYKITETWGLAAAGRFTRSQGSGQVPAQPFHESMMTLSTQIQL